MTYRDDTEESRSVAFHDELPARILGAKRSDLDILSEPLFRDEGLVRAIEGIQYIPRDPGPSGISSGFDDDIRICDQIGARRMHRSLRSEAVLVLAVKADNVPEHGKIAPDPGSGIVLIADTIDLQLVNELVHLLSRTRVQTRILATRGKRHHVLPAHRVALTLKRA
jgi:hypothetical protein